MRRENLFYLHIFVLCAFGVAPLYTILSDYAAFFIAHKSTGADVYIFVLFTVLLFPTLLALAFLVSTLISKKASGLLRPAILFILSAMIFFPISKKFLASSDALTSVVAITLSLALTFAYQRLNFIKIILTIATPVIVFFPILFIFNPSIQKITRGPSATKAPEAPIVIKSDIPIIMVVFDELPLTSLMDSSYRIDPVSFPNLASFASKSHWFRNATTVSTDTIYALPAILTGKYQDGKERLPVVSDYPENLFTLLKDHYEIVSFESNTGLCPVDANKVASPDLGVRLPRLLSNIFNIYLHHLLPAGLGTRALAPIDQGWKTFDPQADFAEKQLKRSHNRKEMFLDFVGQITDGKKPQFYFLHTLLPHHPWLFYPSGNIYNRHGHGQKGIVGLGNNFSWPANEEWPVVQAYQRHLLQTAFTDMIFGELIAKLKDTGLFERSLIIVTADHGASFRAGDNMRSLTETNYLDIMRVPLFIKTPFQKSGKISERNAELIDILPTITEALDIKAPWKTDGTDLFDAKSEERGEKVIFNEVSPLGAPDERYVKSPRLSEKFDAVDQKLKIFSGGLFKPGKLGQIVGRDTKELWHAERSGVIIELILQEPGASAEGLISGQASNIEGSIRTLPLALAIDGKVIAVTRTLGVTNGAADFSFLLPDITFKAGANETEIFVIDDPDKPSLRLTTIAREKRPPFSLKTDGDGHSIVSYDDQGDIKDKFRIKKAGNGGRVEKVLEFEGAELHIVGWAANQETRKLPNVIMGLVDGDYAFHIKTHESRPDIAKKYGLPDRSGFDLYVPAPLATRLDENSGLRLFAIFEDSSAIELAYPRGALMITGAVD